MMMVELSAYNGKNQILFYGDTVSSQLVLIA
jgi:hypothetical protein